VTRASLRIKIAALLVVMSFIPVGVVAIFDIREARARIFRDETVLLAARADQLVGELDAFNQGYARAVSRLASLPEVIELLAAEPGAPSAVGALTATLGAHASGDPTIRGVGVIDRAGRVRAATEPALVDQDRGFRGYVQRGLRGAAGISDPYVSEHGEPSIAYVAPVWGAARTVVGLAVLWIHADALWAMARRSNGLAGDGSYAVIFDHDGIRIAHTYSRDIVFHPAATLPAEATARAVAERRFGAATRALLDDVRPFPAQFERARAERCDPGLFRGLAPVNHQLTDGVGRRFATVPWTVFYMVPEATLTAPIAGVTRWRLVVSVAVALAALGIGVGFAGMLTRPIRRLAGATSAVAAGDLATRVALDRGDELGQLGQAFDAMAERLEHQAGEVRRSHAGLERLVEDRTAELVTSNDALKAEIAERARAEAATVASERKYRELYEHSPDMYITADLHSERITDCNQTLCERLGYERSELLGQPIAMLYRLDELPDRAAIRAKLDQTSELVDLERTLRCKDGRSIDVSLNVRGIRDATGQLASARAVWRDITKRKQIERDRQLLIQLGETLRASPDIPEVLEAVATRLAEYLGVSRCMFSEIDTASDEITIHRDYHRGHASLAGHLALSAFGGGTAAAYARGETVAISDTATDPRSAASFETSYRPLAIRAVVTVPLLRGDLWVAAVSVCSDEIRVWEDRELALITLVAERVWLWIEHLQALARLRDRDVALAVQHTEATFRALVDAVKDYAIYMLDPDGNVATWNAGAERLKGYTRAEIVGQSLFETAEDRASGHPRFMLDQARRNGSYEEEGWRVRKDGSRFWANVVITSVHGRDGEVEGFAKVTRDFTERRAQDAAMRAKQAALARSLKEREVLLQEVHHRVKNNLQVISSLINMQMRKLEDRSTRDALSECQTRVLAIALIHEKLYQTKDYAHVRFSEYARSLAGNVFHATGTSPHEVSLELAIEDVPLGIDRAIPCGLVVNELISNALKHGFKDLRRGCVRVELVAVEDGKLRLTVQDDGVGLPEGFDIHKVESMGLQLVCTLAEQLDADLVVRSDRGAAFQLTFPGSG